MNCYTAGIIGIGMLAATFSTMTVSEDQHDVLRKTLSPKLTEIYTNISIERRNIYFQGLLFGLFVSYFLLRFTKTTNLFHRITFYLALTIPISVLYYFLIPKTDYMLNHLKTPEENKAWLEVYNYMKHRYIFGFIFGSLSAIPISYALC